jgi:hypothetical protein
MRREEEEESLGGDLHFYVSKWGSKPSTAPKRWARSKRVTLFTYM